MRGAGLLLPLAMLACPAGAGAEGGDADADAAMRKAVTDVMRVCWKDVRDLPDPQRLRVKVEILLEPDGQVKRTKVLEPSAPAARDQAMRTAIERALEAVEHCAPFALPPERYDTWKRLIIDFGPEPAAMS